MTDIHEDHILLPADRGETAAYLMLYTGLNGRIEFTICIRMMLLEQVRHQGTIVQ